MNTKKWTTRDGQKIRIKDMTDSHLLNTLKFIKRSCMALQERVIENSLSLACIVSGEMASYYADQDMDNALRTHWSEYATEIFEDMLEDGEKRNLLNASEFLK